MKTKTHGLEAEHSFYLQLNKYGRKVSKMNGDHPFDILADGWRVEVKSATPRTSARGKTIWVFNIHHGGRLEEQCDFYAFRISGIPGRAKRGTWILLMAPLRVKTVRISLRQIKSGKFENAQRDLLDFELGKFGIGPTGPQDIYCLCKICGKNFRQATRNHKFCSQKCGRFSSCISRVVYEARLLGLSISELCLELKKRVDRKG